MTAAPSNNREDQVHLIIAMSFEACGIEAFEQRGDMGPDVSTTNEEIHRTCQ
jgi:hypothetical protein